MNLIIINSFGPMASSVVASIIEHYNYLNFHSMRKHGLEDYLSNPNELKFVKIKDSVLKRIEIFSKPAISGGISVLDRDSQTPTQRYDKENFLTEIENYKKKNFSTIKDLYYTSYNLFNDIVIYKEKIINPKGAVELSNNIHRFDIKKIQDSYTNEFKDIYFINIKRNFYSWLNSFASQFYAQKKLSRKNLFFRVSSILTEFNRYESQIEKFDGMNVDFDEIFLPNTGKFLTKMSKFLNENENIEWVNLKYDLYGLIKNYKETFTKHDDNVRFLPGIFMTLLKKVKKFYLKNFLIDFILDVIFQVIYILGYFKFSRRLK